MAREKKRKSLMVDAEIADAVKKTAQKHGMTVSTYVRMLLEAALRLEEHGVFAPSALRTALILRVLTPFTLLAVPVELIAQCSLEEAQAREIGRRLGIKLRSLGVDGMEVLDIMTSPLGVTVRESNRILIVHTEKTSPSLLGVVVGIAEAYGYRVEEAEGVTIIEQRAPEKREQ